MYDDSKILCTLQCLGLTVALSLATQRAKRQHIHHPMEGMEGEVGQTCKAVNQSIKQSNIPLVSYQSCKKSVTTSVEINQCIENKLHNKPGDSTNLPIN